MPESAYAENRHGVRWTRPAVADGIEGRDPGAKQRTDLGAAQRIGHPRQRNGWSDQVVGVATVISDARSSEVLAGHVIATPARLALPAVAAIPAQPDALPNSPLTHALANRIYQTDDLMPWHSRIRDRENAFLGRRIAVANPAGLHPHPNLASPRVRHFPRHQFDRSSLADHLRISPRQLRHRSFSFQRRVEPGRLCVTSRLVGVSVRGPCSD